MRLTIHQLVTLFCLTLCAQVLTADKTCSGYGQFFGGSVSYTLEEAGGNFTIQLDVITGWVLGMGPCGRHCNKSSVGQSTKQTRLQMENEMNSTTYFGEWSSEIQRHSQPLQKSGVTDKVRADMTGSVLAVSETSKWEQELLKVSLPVEDNLSHKDINYDGCSWRNLSRQGESLPWHIQAKVDPVKVRSDTRKPNGSPQVLYKPFYRLKLNKESTIQIAATDPDDDYVKCGESEYVEKGVFANVNHSIGGVTVNEDCSIRINTSTAYGFQDQDWAAIVITVRDFNKKSLYFGSDTQNVIASGMFSLSATAVQFLVLVLANLQEPEFVDPTLEGNHLFQLYADTTWTTGIYAKAHGNATLEEFIVIGRHGEQLVQTPIKDDKYRPGVKYITLSWEPKITDFGNHLVCIRAVDNTGVDTSMDRCFIINVGERNFTGVTYVDNGKPYFCNLPRLEDLICDVDTTCVIPIYVKSHGNASITDIRITQMFVDTAHVSAITKNGQNDFKTNLYFKDSKSGIDKICMVAEDSNGMLSNETCIDSNIKPADPCKALPCENSGVCNRNQKDEADYICVCSARFTGKNCEKEKTKKAECVPSPCFHGVCTPGQSSPCKCQDGYGGYDCGTQILQNCSSDPCQHHGVCREGTGSCDCFHRYTGDACSTDLCPSQMPNVSTCPNVPGCGSSTCNGHGVCSAGGICICSYGYIGAQCDTGRGDLISSKIKFVPPTPEQSSSLNCYFYTPSNCVFTVFFTTPASTSSTVVVGQQSDDLQGYTSVGPITEEKNIKGVQHLYKAEVTITKGHAFKKNLAGRRYLCLVASESIIKSSDNRCFEVVLLYNSAYVPKSQEFKQQRAGIKFVSPTPLAESKFVCSKDVRCHIFLHTSSGSQCEPVLTSSKEASVFPAISTQHSCVTEASYSFNTTGEHHICFISAPTDGQTRCFNIDVYSNTSDPCQPSPCQNHGLCFHKGTNDSYCVCPNQYTGDRCERGPCPAGDTTCDTGFCFVDNQSKMCLCPIGFNGSACDQKIPLSAPDPEHLGAVFTDSAVPSVITCVKNKPCTVPFLLSGNYSSPSSLPTVKPGYVDPSVDIDLIAVNKFPGNMGSFQGRIQLMPSKPGIHDICLQTADQLGINRDEICFSVDVKTDTSTLYGFNELPHFIDPSIPASSVVSCGVGEPCHMMFHVTPGDNHTGECVHVKDTKKNFQTLHVFSSCDCADGEVGLCTPCSNGSVANNNCTIDVSLTPTYSDIGVGTEVCLQASLHGSGLKGEERCINVTVEELTEHKKARGCQTLHCHNGGFCDGHMSTPLCYCPFGYTGLECEIDLKGNLLNGTDLPALLNTQIPDEVKCYKHEVCEIPFQVVSDNQTRPLVSTGFIDPHLKLVRVEMSNGSLSNSSQIYSGSVEVNASVAGSYELCLQTHRNTSITTDEECITVNVDAATRPPVDPAKPHFLSPSPLQGSTLTCVAEQSCYFNLFYTTGDIFGRLQTCPALSQPRKSNIDGLHIYETKYTVSACSSMITYIPHTNIVGSVKQLCFEVSIPGKRGEERCFNIKVGLKNEHIGPCKGTFCLNGGHCIADLTTNKNRCVCPAGYFEPDCKPVTVSSMKNKTAGLPGTPAPIFTDSTIPSRIICYEGIECTVPLTVHGNTDPSKRPIVGFGHIDPAIYPGIPTVAPTTPSGSYMAVLPFTPRNGSSGSHQVCTQTIDPVSQINVDEVCFAVDVVRGHRNATTIQKPPVMLAPSLNSNTTLLCSPSEPCHIYTMYKKGTNNSRCPSIEQATSVEHVFSFPPQLQNDTCFVDTVLTPKGPQIGKTVTICLHPRDVSDSRCYHVQIKNNLTNSGPCRRLHCKNGGFCDQKNGNAVCVCRSGYSGTTCENATSVHLVQISTSGLPGVPPPIFTDSAIPDMIVCYQGVECKLPLSVSGNNDTSKKPQIVFGHVDPGINQGQTTVTPTSPAGNYMAVIAVTPHNTTTGVHQVCTQTKDPTLSVNVDEICFHVYVKAGSGNKSPDMTNPRITTPTVNGNSSMICRPDVSCHIFTTYTLGANLTQCPRLEQTTAVEHVVSFSPTEVNKTCIVDTVVTPSTTDAGNILNICLRPRQGSDRRCYEVRVNSTITATGPCQKIHCRNNGACESTSNGAVCSCLRGFDGEMCENATSSVTETLPGVSGIVSKLQPGTSFFDKSSAILTTINCELNKRCYIPVVYNGNETNPPVLGHVDPQLNVSEPVTVFHGTTNMPNGTHLIQTSVLPNGTGKLCLQTKETVTGRNIDEICIQVNIVPSPPTVPVQTKPHFLPPSLTNGSEVLCLPRHTCHLPVVTPTDQNGKCTVQSVCSKDVEGVHVFEPHLLSGGKCATDVTFTSKQTNIKGSICISSGPDGEERVFTVNQKLPTNFGPCQTLHCENGGTCDQQHNVAVCLCRPIFTGTACQSYISTTQSTTEFITSSTSSDTLETTELPTTSTEKLSTHTTEHLTTTLDTFTPESTTDFVTSMTSSEQNTLETTETHTELTTISSTQATDHQTITSPTYLQNGASTSKTNTFAATSSDLLSTTVAAHSNTVHVVSGGISTVTETPTGIPTTNPSTAEATSSPLSSTIFSAAAVSSTNKLSTASTTSSLSTETPSTVSAPPTTTTKAPATIASSTKEDSSASLNAVLKVTSIKPDTFTPESTTDFVTSMTSSEQNTLETTETHTELTTISSTQATDHQTITSPTYLQNGASTSKTNTFAATSSDLLSTTVAAHSNTVHVVSGGISTVTETPTGIPTTNPSTAEATSSPLSSTIFSAAAVSSTNKLSTASTTSSLSTETPSTVSAPPTTTTKAPATIASSTKEDSSASLNAVLKVTSIKPGTCSMKEASKNAEKAVKLGHTSCYCIMNGTKRQIIRRRPVATTTQMLRSAGIGAGSSVGLIGLLAVVYLLISKLRKTKQKSKLDARIPLPSPRARAKVHPQRRDRF